MTVTTARTFAEVSAVTRTGPGRYRADLDPLWGYAGNPNGGYLQATMARAALDTAGRDAGRDTGRDAGRDTGRDTGRDHVLSAGTHYLSPPGPGPADIATVVLRAGRSTTQVRTTLSQSGEEKVEAVFILGHLADPASSRSWRSARLQPPGPGYDDCVPHAPDLDRIPATVMHQIDLRLDPGSLEFYEGNPRGLGELRGWVDLPGGEDFDPVSLLFAADIMPPATYDVAFSGWVPTLTMSTYIRALPAPGPLELVIDATLIQGGTGDETCTLRDSTGTVVAQSHQLAGVRLP